MSHFGRAGPPDIIDTYSLLVLNITFRQLLMICFPFLISTERLLMYSCLLTGDSRGFAFVRHKYADETQKAVDKLDRRVVDGREIMVQFAKYGPDVERMSGPLHKVYHGNEEDSEFKVTECDGRAVSFLYKAVSKDSVLVTVWSGGQLQIDALADELQPKNGIDDDMRLSTVQSVLNTCQVESSVSSLYGFVALADSFGSCWIVGLTSGFECIVLGMESWNLLLPAHVDKEKKFESLEENTVPGDATIISKELLAGPKVVIVPPTSPNPVAADSIEGRSTLHQYFKLFHENYVEYAHKVYFELKHHGPQLKKIIDEQHARLREAQQKLAKVEEKQENLENRIDRVIQTHGLLEERLLNLRNLLGIHKKPLSKAEREFKMELDKFRGVEIDALHTTIETINGRIKRYSSSPQSKRPNQRRLIAGRRMSNAEDDEMAHLKSSIAKLSLVNSENTKKVKLVDSALRNHESSRRVVDGREIMVQYAKYRPDVERM
uniref:Putative nucleotide-binding alpha-beta plait domain-containing protein n=1 Tax=Helianthus annuus TaxID=4232 RepID=A0A251SNV3_HELAN